MSIAKDKKIHFIVCLIAAVAMMVLMRLISSPLGVAAMASVISSLALGIGKEYGDKVNPSNKWDWNDLLADFIGAISGTAVGCLFWII